MEHGLGDDHRTTTMKACRVCGRLYTGDAAFCQADGHELVSVTRAPRPEDASDPLVGQVICDRYLVTRLVAEGGVGRVYEGLDQQAHRHVALKVLNPLLGLEQVSIERFKREYEVSRQLSHRHIVEVTDFQRLGDSYVLVMEFLVGEELRAVLRREGTLRPERVVRMLSQIAIGLGGAHLHQLVHRDLKPDNIFLCQTSAGDIAKVLDFGSVKDCNQGAKQLTMMGTTIGSPFYMSPEQAQGLDTMDQRTDIWGLSVVVYECLTGTVPFKGTNGPSILIEILAQQPLAASRAASASRAIPEAVDRVLAKGLEKAPHERISTAGGLADQLGWAYGLVGNHALWAYVPEPLLGAQIATFLRTVNTPAGRAGSGGMSTRSKGRWSQWGRAKAWVAVVLLVVVGGILGAMWMQRYY
jgi:serine/threonine protein kinase